MRSGAATIAEYSYDAVGNRMQQTNGNGTSTEYALDSDPRYRVASITHKRGSNVLAQIGYPSRDSVGNPLGMTDWTGTWGYDYDSNNRLIGATPLNPVQGQPAGGDYEYDWVGNRIHPPGGPNPMVYNDGDQLVRWPGMYRYSYDGAGNLVQAKNDSQTQVLKSYTYTPAGLLATATFRDKDGNTRTLTNTWDADSNRISFDANGTEYKLVYEPNASVPAVLEESTANSTAYYIREPGGSLIARLNATDGIRYYHFDELGSTRLLTNSNGDITDRYAYDAYGSLLSHDCYSGSVSQPYQYVGQLGYYTHYIEPDFGLLQLGVRFYDPEVGRFTQRDPAKDGINWVGYTGAMPTAAIDPTGRFYSREKCLRLAGEIVKRTADLLYHWAKPEVQQCGGFDPGHLKEVRQKWEKLQELISEFNKHCSGRKPPLPPLPEPVPRPVPAPAPAPAPKPSPGQTCVKVGVGVVILICVWEGAKWTCGALAAPATGGASLCVCGALP